MKFRDIPQMSRANYSIDVPLDYLQHTINRYTSDYDLDFDPPFQRHYVWTNDQKIAYVEYVLKGGRSGLDIYFNCPYWMHYKNNPKMTVVDGKQRLSAMLGFLNNQIPAFGSLFKDYEDRIGAMMGNLKFHINDIVDPRAVVQWYLDMNTGGTYHTSADIDRAKAYMETLK